MRKTLGSVVRWWLARKLPADLKCGDICLVASGDKGYKVVKILAIDKSAIHVRLYRERFSQVPRLLNTAALTLGTIHDDDYGLGHLPLSRATFATWRPMRMQYDPVTEDELDGYRMWKEAQGGTWD